MTHNKNHRSKHPKAKQTKAPTERELQKSSIIEGVINDINISPFAYSIDGIDFITTLLRSKNLPKESGQLLFNKLISVVFALPNLRTTGIADVIINGALDPNNIIDWYRKNLEITQPIINTLLKNELKGKEPRTSATKKILKKYYDSSREDQISQTRIKIKLYGFETTIDRPTPSNDYSIPQKTWIKKHNALAEILPEDFLSSFEPSAEKFPSVENVIFTYFRSVIKMGFNLLKENKLQSIGISDTDNDKDIIKTKLSLVTLAVIKNALDVEYYSEEINLCFKIFPIDTIYKLKELENVELLTKLTNIILSGDYDIKTKQEILAFKFKTLYSKNFDQECKNLFNEYLPNSNFTGVLKLVFIGATGVRKLFSQDEIENIYSVLNIPPNAYIIDPPTKKISEIPSTKQEIYDASRKGYTTDLLHSYVNNFNVQSLKHTFEAILKLDYNLNFFLPFTLDLVHSLDNVANAESLYGALSVIFSGKSCYENELEKISRSKELYISLNKIAEKEEAKASSEVIEQKEETLSDDELDSANLAYEAKKFVDDNSSPNIKTQISP